MLKYLICNKLDEQRKIEVQIVLLVMCHVYDIFVLLNTVPVIHQPKLDVNGRWRKSPLHLWLINDNVRMLNAIASEIL